MAFLRFTRDKRGYENTYLVHQTRRRGKATSRVLYWFRTPPNVRVGRSAFDEEAIRLIEEAHPELAFDWPRILRTPVTVESGEPARQARSAGAARPATAGAAAAVQPLEDARGGLSLSKDALGAPPLAKAVDRPPPAAVGETFDEGADDAGHEATRSAAGVVERLVGAEQLERLRGRHAELLARIAERIADPRRRDELRAQAEAVDPDTWVTEEDARRALASYEQVYGSVRGALGRRKRRSRRGKGRGPGGSGPVPGGGAPEQG